MKKIMFNDQCGLTQAVLQGRKTMTRRVIKNVPMVTFYNAAEFYLYDKLENKNYQVRAIFHYAKYREGEKVAIGQNYKDCSNENLKPRFRGQIFPPYRIYNNLAGWNNKMFVQAGLMPHHIRINNIRVERLQDISEEDCMREGIQQDYDGAFFVDSQDLTFSTAKRAFSYLIDKVSGKGTWESNPYVFVYEFELVD